MIVKTKRYYFRIGFKINLEKDFILIVFMPTIEFLKSNKIFKIKKEKIHSNFIGIYFTWLILTFEIVFNKK